MAGTADSSTTLTSTSACDVVPPLAADWAWACAAALAPCRRGLGATSASPSLAEVGTAAATAAAAAVAVVDLAAEAVEVGPVAAVAAVVAAAVEEGAVIVVVEVTEATRPGFGATAVPGARLRADDTVGVADDGGTDTVVVAALALAVAAAAAVGWAANAMLCVALLSICWRAARRALSAGKAPPGPAYLTSVMLTANASVKYCAPTLVI